MHLKEERKRKSGEEVPIPVPSGWDEEKSLAFAENPVTIVKISSVFPERIEEKKYTKWMDYDKIEKNPYIRTRRTGEYMVINAQGNTKKLNRCMIDEKIPSEYRDSIPLIACGKEILWMVGSRMNERYKINPKTRKVLVLNYQGGNENERENQSFTQRRGSRFPY